MVHVQVISVMGPDAGGMGATTAMACHSEPDEVAHVIAFLAGDRSSYLTGATVAVDGGRTAI